MVAYRVESLIKKRVFIYGLHSFFASNFNIFIEAANYGVLKIS